jgi:hypothetical protein
VIYIPLLTELRRIAAALERAFPGPVVAAAEPTEAISYVDDGQLARQQLRDEAVKLGLANPRDPLDEEEAELLDGQPAGPHLV